MEITYRNLKKDREKGHRASKGRPTPHPRSHRMKPQERRTQNRQPAALCSRPTVNALAPGSHKCPQATPTPTRGSGAGKELTTPPPME